MLPEWEDLIEEQGGTGPFQIYAFLILSFANAATMFMSCALALLLLPPDYICEQKIGDEWFPLEDKEFC